MNPLMTIDLGALHRQDLLAEGACSHLIPSTERSAESTPRRLLAVLRRIPGAPSVHVPRIRPVRS